MENTDLIGVDALAREFDVKPRTIWKWVNDGRIPSVRVTRKIVKFERNKVLAALRHKVN